MTEGVQTQTRGGTLPSLPNTRPWTSYLQEEPSGNHVSNLGPWHAFLAPRSCFLFPTHAGAQNQEEGWNAEGTEQLSVCRLNGEIDYLSAFPGSRE